MARAVLKSYNKIYYILLFFSIVILAFFSYLSYLAFLMTLGTELVIYSYIIVLPVISSLIILILLLYLGRKKFKKEVMKAK